VILHFLGGPMDGLEEESGQAPEIVFRMPPIGELVRAVETARNGEEPPDFGATYLLVDVTAGVATYQVQE
jgi:hypothetical protein